LTSFFVSSLSSISLLNSPRPPFMVHLPSIDTLTHCVLPPVLLFAITENLLVQHLRSHATIIPSLTFHRRFDFMGFAVRTLPPLFSLSHLFTCLLTSFVLFCLTPLSDDRTLIRFSYCSRFRDPLLSRPHEAHSIPVCESPSLCFLPHFLCFPVADGRPGLACRFCLFVWLLFELHNQRAA